MLRGGSRFYGSDIRAPTRWMLAMSKQTTDVVEMRQSNLASRYAESSRRVMKQLCAIITDSLRGTQSCRIGSDTIRHGLLEILLRRVFKDEFDLTKQIRIARFSRAQNLKRFEFQSA